MIGPLRAAFHRRLRRRAGHLAGRIAPYLPTGATVLAIIRHGEQVLVTSGHDLVLAGDLLAVAGSEDAIAAARDVIAAS